jgi:hypothetical protein
MERLDLKGVVGSTRVFISYSSADSAVVHPLGMLLAAAGSTPFVDKHSLTPGANWRDGVDEAIRNCHAMLVFWTASAAASEQVRREYRLGLELGKPVVPVLISKEPLPLDLAEIHGVDLLSLFARWPAEIEQSEAWLKSVPKGASMSYTPPELHQLDDAVAALEKGLHGVGIKSPMPTSETVWWWEERHILAMMFQRAALATLGAHPAT